MRNFINLATSEEEQVEQIKKWIKENSFFLVAGIIISLSGIFGWDYYQNYQLNKNIIARSNYLTLENNIGGEVNFNNHNAYKQQSKMLKAKNKIIEKKYDSAITILQSFSSDNIFQDVINLKIAKLYLAQSKFKKALEILKNNKLTSVSKHLIGDIYQAMGKKELAKETYQVASLLTINQQLKSLIDFKINNLK